MIKGTCLCGGLGSRSIERLGRLSCVIAGAVGKPRAPRSFPQYARG